MKCNNIYISFFFIKLIKTTVQKIPKNLSITGYLTRIVSYEIHHDSTTGPSGHTLIDSRITTKLEILANDGKIIPVDFCAYVGSELINHKITYIVNGEVTTGDVSTVVGVRHARQEVITQKLLPQDENLPKYLVSNCVYQG